MPSRSNTRPHNVEVSASSSCGVTDSQDDVGDESRVGSEVELAEDAGAHRLRVENSVKERVNNAHTRTDRMADGDERREHGRVTHLDHSEQRQVEPVSNLRDKAFH